MKSSSRTPSAAKRPKTSRDSDTGRFAESSSFDPHELVKMVRAIKDLEPFLAGAALAHIQADEKDLALQYSFVGSFLANIKHLALRDLCADSESLNEAKKLRLDAKSLGNLPLQEQERIRKLASDWMLTPDVTPRSLLVDALRSEGLVLKEVPEALQ